MQKELIRILLIDDDQTFGKACSRTLEQLGYKVTWAKMPLEAISLAKVNAFQVILIDCMLPKIPGTDLAIQLKPLQNDNTLMILMSGIYKDKNFIRQAVQRTGLSDFLVKPFSSEDFEKILNRKFEGLIEESTDPLPRLLTADKIRPRKIVEALEESDIVHGYELPFIYSLLINASLSGQLNIAQKDGNIFGVTLSQGRIVSVATNDPPSQLGELLMEKGLVEKSDIEAVMSKPSSQKIGDRLVCANLISPHMLDEILVEQMGVRLTKTVIESSVDLNFTQTDVSSDCYGIDDEMFTLLLEQWLGNQISLSWLKSYYHPWLDHRIKEGILYSSKHPLTKSKSKVEYEKFFTDLKQAETILGLINSGAYSEEKMFSHLHLLTITRYLGFGNPSDSTDYATQKLRLAKIYKDVQSKNYFEILNLSKDARPSEIRRAFSELSKVLDPENLAADAPDDLRTLNELVFDLIKTAYHTIGDEEKRKEYLLEVREQNATKMLFAENMLEQGKQLLAAGQAQKALDKFTEAFEINKDNPDILGYRIWAQLKLLNPKKVQEQLIQIDRDIMAFSQHSRQSALFHFIKGLFNKEKGNLPQAKTHIENAINIDPNFLEARRELNVLKLKQKKEQPVDLLRGDLRDVVGMLFRRKP